MSKSVASIGRAAHGQQQSAGSCEVTEPRLTCGAWPAPARRYTNKSISPASDEREARSGSTDDLPVLAPGKGMASDGMGFGIARRRRRR